MRAKNLKAGDTIRINNLWKDSPKLVEGKVMTTYTENGKDYAEVYVERHGSTCVSFDDLLCREFLFGVSMSGMGSVIGYRIAAETLCSFVLEDGTIVYKNRCGGMEKNGVRYFLNENEAVIYKNNIQYNCRF